MSVKSLNEHRAVLVMGLGLFGGGEGAARFWAELGATVTVTDLRDAAALRPSLERLQDCEIRYALGGHDETDFKSTDVVVVNPAVRPDNKFLRLAMNSGAEIQTEVGLLLRLLRGPVLAVTGSNGKSTTTALLGAMLQAHDPETLVGGNLGGSLLPELKTHRPSAPVVLELSSFQLHYLKRQEIAPRIAVITNLSPNHLDWHRTKLAYYEDKRNILRFQQSDEWAVLNHDDPVLREWGADTPAQVLYTSRIDPETPHACFVRETSAGQRTIILRLDGAEREVADLSLLHLPGTHNEHNAVQAAAAAYLYCENPGAIRAGLESFTGLPHRLELVGECDGKRFINDSIATTPESTICALHSFRGPKVLIAGGYDKGVSYDELGQAIAEEEVHAAVLIGDAAGPIRIAIEKALHEHETRVLEAGRVLDPEESPLVVDAGPDFDTAIRIAGEICPGGGTVLLSPACASYGMFNHFAERGDCFRHLVGRMASAPASKDSPP